MPKGSKFEIPDQHSDREDTLNKEAYTRAAKESYTYFTERYQRLQEILSAKRDEIAKMISNRLALAGTGNILNYEFFSSEQIGAALGLEEKDRDILNLLTDRFNSAFKSNLTPIIMLIAKNKDPEAIRVVDEYTKVLTGEMINHALISLNPTVQAYDAMGEMRKGKGWYYETDEGKETLSKLKEE